MISGNNLRGTSLLHQHARDFARIFPRIRGKHPLLLKLSGRKQGICFIKLSRRPAEYLLSRPSSAAALTPPACKYSPTIRLGGTKERSMTVTRRPSRARTVASAEPSVPDPTMITSGSVSRRGRPYEATQRYLFCWS